MPADDEPWIHSLSSSLEELESLAVRMSAKAGRHWRPQETPLERLRRIHREIHGSPRPTLTVIRGGRDDA
jgi:hypothetical protein